MTSKWEKYKLLKKKFQLENLKVGYQLVVTAVDREISLNYSLQKWDVRMGSGLIWLRTGTFPLPQNEKYFLTGRENNDFTGRIELGLHNY
jgi:hypothetical protein